ncbi:MAG: L-aspartate oxidase [Bryobacterales bacterium]|nr:L-aspartate oxidase [Bryobacteraceae bacterium]MDW8354739.1 L-aspartate oxidase [Bryobacterales bacterium]
MHPDFLVVGAGVAGLRAAIELAQAGRVLVIAKDSLDESSSQYAQGGIAAALSDDDEVELHEQDTLAAGDGLCDRAAVRTLVEEGPAAIQELIEWGAQFDREGSRLAFTQEGAHSRRRVLHAQGDSTGREISRTLYHKAASLGNVEFRSFTAVTDLLLADGEVVGVVACDAATQQAVPLYARGVLLATGGLGRVYRETTNPDVATGDGVAAAYRAGAEISDIEFVQFHPTALHLEGAPRFLLSEALRGEGALLRNSRGERFMERYHPLKELAPRDVVSRAIVAEMERTGAPHVFLDLTHLPGEFVRRRFPRIYETCLRYGVDLTKDAAPVHPAAHYAMGGVRTDLDGRTSLPRLFAAGEVAATGVHGANRLASNSLLEGVVFGARAGRAMRELTKAPFRIAPALPEVSFPDIAERELRDLTWRYCGILRCGEGLERACQQLGRLPHRPCAQPTRRSFELRNMVQVAWLIAYCALARKESRGAHFRTDYPQKRSEYQKHSVISKHCDAVRFV